MINTIFIVADCLKWKGSYIGTLAIKVLKEVMHIKEIPEHYIFKKMDKKTKKIRAENVQDMDGHEIQANR